MIKISIVFLYLRIFRGNLLKYLVWATQAVNVAVAIIFIVGLLIVCQPLPFYWAYADDTQGTCHDYIDESGVYRQYNSSPATCGSPVSIPWNVADYVILGPVAGD